jgi:hypothetical protein
MKRETEFVRFVIDLVDDSKPIQASSFLPRLRQRDDEFADRRSGIRARRHNSKTAWRLQTGGYAWHRSNEVRVRIRTTAALGVMGCPSPDGVQSHLPLDRPGLDTL